MRKKALSVVFFILLLAASVNGFCDYATTSISHLKKAGDYYANKDYKATIYEACNGLYHQRQKAAFYRYLGYSYESLKEPAMAVISYMKFLDTGDPSEWDKIKDRINSLKSKIDEKELAELISKKDMRLLIKETSYKGNKPYRIRDYIYNPVGKLIEEKYCRPDYSYEYRIEYLYDKAGNLTEKNKFKDDGTKLETELYSYYENGHLAQIARNGTRGTLLDKTVYTYDFVNSDVLKSILKYDEKGNMISKKGFLYAKNNIYEETVSDYLDASSLNNYTIKYKYENALLVEKSFNYTMGLSETVKYIYKNNKLTEEISYDKENVPVKSKKYMYSANGELTDIEEYEIWMQKKYTLKSKSRYEYANL